MIFLLRLGRENRLKSDSESEFGRIHQFLGRAGLFIEPGPFHFTTSPLEQLPKSASIKNPAASSILVMSDFGLLDAGGQNADGLVGGIQATIALADGAIQAAGNDCPEFAAGSRTGTYSTEGSSRSALGTTGHDALLVASRGLVGVLGITKP
jgi:hypothetical protein